MKMWLIEKYEILRENFWFIPTVMVIAAGALSQLALHLDKATPGYNWIAELGWTFTRGPEGSRAVLSTVAGSMMTIASVTFSITVVALQLASSQFGPRLLRNFMRDRGNQVSIGTFIATFTYCLLVLRTVNGMEGEQFVPHIAVTMGLLLALISVGVFIYFIHHAAESIQAENIITAVSRECRLAIDRLYPDSLGHEPDQQAKPVQDCQLPENFAREARAVACRQSDYLQAVDIERLLRLATEHDLLLSISRRPGKFFIAGDHLVRAWPADRVDDDLAGVIRNCFYFGIRRTLVQDVEFAIDQLVEVAVRALSPGINDPFTAMNCVERLGAALCELASRAIPPAARHDEHGKLRIVTDSSSATGMIDAAFNQIRQAAWSDTSVTLRLLETIADVARHTNDPDFLASLRRHAEAVHRGSQAGLKDAGDRKEAERRFREAIEALDSQSAGGAKLVS